MINFSPLNEEENILLTSAVSMLEEILRDINHGKYQINSGIRLADVDERESQKETISLMIELFNKWKDA